MATAYTDQVQKVYIAYYGRAADPVGLAYWAAKVETDGLAGIMASFGASAEATTLYGSLTNTAKVNALYQQSFGRDADFAGLMYYAGQLTAGTMTAASIAQNIFDGASGNDATIIANKLVVAKAYTAAVDTAAEVVAYSGTVAAASARSLLSTVDADTATASFDVATTVASIVTAANVAAVVAGTTFALTTVTDTLAKNTGGVNDDDFVGAMTFTSDALASSATLTAGDTMSGGAGTDTLTVTVTGSAVTDAGETATPTLVGIERVHVRSFENDASGNNDAAADINSDSVTMDLSNADSSLTEVGTTSTSNTEADVVFANVGTLANVVMAGKGDLRIEYATATVAGAADSTTLTLDDVGTSATVISDVNIGGIETLNVVSSGAANFLQLEAGALTTVNVSGAKALNVEVADTDVTVFDASTATGAITADLSAITTTALTSVIGGTGSADSVQLGGAALTVSASANGLSKFSGFETLIYDTAHTITMSANTSGINSFDLTGGTDQVLTLDLGYTGATAVTIKGDAANGDTVSNNANVALTVTANMADLDGTLTGGTGTDTLNVTMDGATQTVLSTLTNFETINVTSSTTAGTDGGLTMNNANVAATKSMTVNASTLASNEVFTFSAAAELSGSYTVTGGAAADSLTGGSGIDTITGGAGNDTIDGGAGNDTLNGGLGIDTITAGTGVDTIDGGAGNDIIISAGNLTSADTIDGGAGTDTLRVTSITAANLTGVSNIETLQLTDAGTATLTTDLSFSTIDLTQGATTETVTFSTGYTKTTTVKVDVGDTVTNTAADITMTVVANSDDMEAGDNTIITGSDKTGVVNTLTLTNKGATVDLQTDSSALDVINVVDDTTAGNDLTIDLTSYGTALTLDASALDDGEVLTITGASVKNLTITSGAGADTLVLSTQIDNLSGGAGNDTFTAGTSITYEDTIDGGEGVDTMTTGIVDDIDLQNVTSIENMTIDGTSTLGAQASEAGVVQVTVSGGDSVTSTAMTTGVTYVADILSGDDTLTGGQGDDIFSFSGPLSLEDGDVINGTSGVDKIQLDNSKGRVVAETDIDDLTNIDSMVAKDADGISTSQNDSISINIVADARAVAHTFTIDMSKITDANDDVIMTNAGTTNTFTSYAITGGSGDDIIISAAASDTIKGGSGADNIDAGLNNDTLTGGAGADVFEYSSADSKYGDEDIITDFATLSDDINVNMTMTNITFKAAFNTSTTGVNMASYLTNTEDGEAVYDSKNGTLIVDINGDGTLGGNDLFITSANVVAAKDITYAVKGTSAADTMTLSSTANGTDRIIIISATGSEATSEDTINNFGTDDIIVVTGTEATADDFKAAIDVASGQWSDVGGGTVEVILFSDDAITSLTAALWDEDNYQFGMAGAVYQMAASSEITGSNNVDHITGGGTSAGITAGKGADILVGGGGTDTFIMTGSVAGVDQITMADGIDIVSLDLSDIEGLTDITDLVDLSVVSYIATVAITYSSTTAITGAYDFVTGATDDVLAVANINSAEELETALEAGGSRALTANTAWTALDAFLVVYDDGVNSTIAVVSTSAAVVDDATFAAGTLKVTDLAVIVGQADAGAVSELASVA